MCVHGFQGTFAIITAALISGSIVERMRFSIYVLFITLWALAVYSPIAHWVWGGGWLASGAHSILPAGRSFTSTPLAALVAAIVSASADIRLVAASAQRAVHAARRGAPLVRLVWIQCRQRARGEPDRGAGVRDHDAGAGGDAGGLDVP